MKKIITKFITCSALINFFFAAEVAEDDIETGRRDAIFTQFSTHKEENKAEITDSFLITQHTAAQENLENILSDRQSKLTQRNNWKQEFFTIIAKESWKIVAGVSTLIIGELIYDHLSHHR